MTQVVTSHDFKEARPKGRPPVSLDQRVCSSCGRPYSRDGFYHLKNGLPYSACKKCKNRPRDRRAYRRSVAGLASDFFMTIRRRDPHTDLSVAWLKDRLTRGICEVTGIAFDLSLLSGSRNPFGPSVDQKQPGAGYTQANCHMVVWCYNAAKGTGTHDDVLKLARALVTK